MCANTVGSFALAIIALSVGVIGKSQFSGVPHIPFKRTGKCISHGHHDHDCN